MCWGRTFTSPHALAQGSVHTPPAAFNASTGRQVFECGQVLSFFFNALNWPEALRGKRKKASQLASKTRSVTVRTNFPMKLSSRRPN